MGWTLGYVYDLKLGRWLVLVMPVTFGAAPLPTAEAAGSFVISMARQGHALSIKAMRAVMAGPATKPRKRAKK